MCLFALPPLHLGEVLRVARGEVRYEKPPFLGPFRRHSFVWKITIIHTHLPSIAYTVFLCNPLVDKGSQGAPFGAFL